MAHECTVAFLGPEASYTHQATQSFFTHRPKSSNDSTPFTLHPKTTIRDVFLSVQDRTATFGVVPFENSTNGPVSFTLDLFADRTSRCPDVRVCGKTSVAVRHCLLGRRKHQQPHQRPRRQGESPPPSSSSVQHAEDAEAPLSTAGGDESAETEDFTCLKTLFSHPQAWGQCELFLRKYLPHTRREDVSSTAKAAEMAAADGSGASAAVSSAKVAELCALDILARDIQDRDDNVTFFFVVCRVEREGLLERLLHPRNLNDDREDHLLGGQKGEVEEVDGRWKSLITFTVPHAATGAMADVLLVFKERGLNLTNMHQCPRAPDDERHVFCAELQGRKSGEDGGLVGEALRQLNGVVQWKWLGSWRDS